MCIRDSISTAWDEREASLTGEIAMLEGELSEFVDLETLSESVLEAFVTLHEKGLIYKGTYMVNWAPKLQTAVSDLEVEYADEPGTLYYFKYPVEGGEGDDSYLPVATTRPETILGDTAVAVNPEDDRFKKFIGKRCVVPFSGGRTVPIIGDDYVDIEFGTCLLYTSPSPRDATLSRMPSSA